MWFWIFMLVMNLLIPGIMIGCGWLMKSKPPKKINGIYGYRTTRSMKSTEAWQFAQIYFGRIWFRWGWGLLLISVLVMLTVVGRDIDTVGIVGSILCTLQCVILIAPIIPTERELKRKFK